MFPLHVLQIGGHLLHKLLIAEAGGKDQLVALPRHVAHHAFGVSRLGHALDHGGLDLVAVLFLNGLAAQLVLECPAAVADGAHVHKTDLELLGRRRGSGSSRCRCCGLFLLATGRQHGHRHGRQADHLDQGTLAQITHG
ncbi:hypothetical protein SDC9_130508 [bioreactor metagenome]|uniref:Uncharacterized protein n=1 Tax=bioreactor metagenome TaxID=1076179 RepID=A0A645D2D3_9ZZZZ